MADSCLLAGAAGAYPRVVLTCLQNPGIATGLVFCWTRLWGCGLKWCLWGRSSGLSDQDRISDSSRSFSSCKRSLCASYLSCWRLWPATRAALLLMSESGSRLHLLADTGSSHACSHFQPISTAWYWDSFLCRLLQLRRFLQLYRYLPCWRFRSVSVSCVPSKSQLSKGTS